LVTVLRILRDSRHAAAVAALLAFFAGQWVLCPCSASAVQNGKPEHAPTTVQDSHACCETNGIRAGSTCCPAGTLGAAPALATESLDTAAVASTPMALSIIGTPGPQVTHTAVLTARPPFPARLSILRI